MTNDPEREIRQLWQEQREEKITMSINDIRERAKRFERKTRRGYILAAVLLAFGVGDNIWEIWTRPDWLASTGNLLMIAAVAYLVVDGRKWLSVETMPANLGLATSVDFYRAQLLRQRDATRHAAWWFLAFVPGLGLHILGRILERGEAATTVQITVGIVGAVVLFVGILAVNARTARKLEQEIDGLINPH